MVKYGMFTARIKKVIKENERTVTYEFDHRINAEPGNFVMVWLPGIGERPFGIADDDPMTLTITSKGEFTKRFLNLKVKDHVSFRGPMGRPFSLTGRNILVVGGGVGIVPLVFLAKRARESGRNVICVLGLRSSKEMIYKDRLKRFVNRLLITTDDGSMGEKGTAFDGARAILNKDKVDAVYTCGPERMMKVLAEYCKEKEIWCQLSLERYMKCGIGICGSCAIDEMRVCCDGPVFSGEEALSFNEFGRFKRDGSGRKIPL